MSLDIEGLDESQPTRQVPIERPPASKRLITEREHYFETAVFGALMFACGFLAAAIAIAALNN